MWRNLFLLVALLAAGQRCSAFAPGGHLPHHHSRATQAMSTTMDSLARSESIGRAPSHPLHAIKDPVFERSIQNDLFSTPPKRERGPEDEFELNVGRVIDTLQQDYPVIFQENIDFSIYDEDIILQDPSGVQVKGIRNYKRVMATLRFLRQAVMTRKVETRFRVNYDGLGSRIRVSWNFVFIRSDMQAPIYLDGISRYDLNRRGLVQSHTLEQLIVNKTPLAPPFVSFLNVNMDNIMQRSPGVPALNVLNAQTGGRSRKSSKGGGWPNIEIPNGCETSWDCDSPQICCDFLVTKMCCSGGQASPVYVPIPIPVERNY
ncbi:unnamed protein product [Chrysoparadoxa australica]